ARSAVEQVAEIVDGFFSAGLLANDGIGPEPGELALGIEIDTATPGIPLVRRIVENGGGIGGILQVSPSAAPAMIHGRGGGFPKHRDTGPASTGRCARRAGRQCTPSGLRTPIADHPA